MPSQQIDSSGRIPTKMALVMWGWVPEEMTVLMFQGPQPEISKAVQTKMVTDGPTNTGVGILQYQ
jgi:hypothetical protein